MRCLILASPAFSVRLYVPFALPLMRLWRRLRGEFFVNSYVKARLLTHDPERRRSFAADPLIQRPIAATALLELADMGQRVVDNAPAVISPTLLLVSGRDAVVRHEAQHRFYERLGAADKARIYVPGAFHDTLGERDRADSVAPPAATSLCAALPARLHAPVSWMRIGTDSAAGCRTRFPGLWQTARCAACTGSCSGC